MRGCLGVMCWSELVLAHGSGSFTSSFQGAVRIGVLPRYTISSYAPAIASAYVQQYIPAEPPNARAG